MRIRDMRDLRERDHRVKRNSDIAYFGFGKAAYRNKVLLDFN